MESYDAEAGSIRSLVRGDRGRARERRGGKCAILPVLLGEMTAEECRAADWETVGYGDGARGAGAAGIARHRRDCGVHGVAPDLDAYEGAAVLAELRARRGR